MMNQELLIEMAVMTVARRQEAPYGLPNNASFVDIHLDSIVDASNALLRESHLWELLVDHSSDAVDREIVLRLLFDIDEEEFFEDFYEEAI